MATNHVKYIFVTGGVVSSLGKGIASASLGLLLKSRGLRVAVQKFDPYINVDPGTMNPFQHGEVYVTDDGAETDLDLGHYERFLDTSTSRQNNSTTGQIYYEVIRKNAAAIILAPPCRSFRTSPTRSRPSSSAALRLPTTGRRTSRSGVGGTVGDIESLPFLEAARQMGLKRSRSDTALISISPLCRTSSQPGELKTKPTQHSVKKLREIGVQPDILICRTERRLSKEMKEKIALFCNVEAESVIDREPGNRCTRRCP